MQIDPTCPMLANPDLHHENGKNLSVWVKCNSTNNRNNCLNFSWGILYPSIYWEIQKAKNWWAFDQVFGNGTLMEVARRNPGRADFGDLVRDDLGQWIKGFMGYIGTVPSLLAELWAIHDGLKILRFMEHPKIIIEANCEVAIKMLKSQRKRTTMRWTYKMSRHLNKPKGG